MTAGPERDAGNEPPVGGPPPDPSQSEATSRLFIAIPLPGRLRSSIEKLSRNLQTAFEFTPCRPSWTTSASWHLTLRFLGETADERIEALGTELKSVVSGFEAPRLRAMEVGCFPDVRRPRVLWVGMRDKNDQLKPLQRQVEELARQQGFEPEKRPYQPHLTLARFRSQKGVFTVPKIVEAHRNFRTELTPAREVNLYRSVLGREGARHEALVRVSFSDQRD